MNEEAVIRACKNKDGKAQCARFDRYAATMLAICLRYLKKYEETEEVMLKGFHKFFEKIDLFEYRGQGGEKAFLKKIIINECLMSLGEKKALCFENELPENIIDRQENGLEKLAADGIFRLALQLTAGDRTVFNLYVLENLKVAKKLLQCLIFRKARPNRN